MRSIVIGFLTLFMFLGHTHAQIEEASGPMRERVEAMKVAFITEKVGLSPDQSKAFWPVYGEYEDEKKDIRKKYRASKTLMQMSDAELEEQLLKTFQRDEELLKVNRAYFDKFKAVISVRQVALLKKAESDFNKEVLKKMMDWQQQRRRGGVRRNNNN